MFVNIFGWLRSLASFTDSKLRWGKGLASFYTGIWEALDEICSHAANGMESPILVMIGWAGNDVFGDSGYRAFSWIHQAKHNQTAADRKVAAEFQYNKVMAGIEELLKLKRHSHMLDIVVFGCGDSGSFGLPPSSSVSRS